MSNSIYELFQANKQLFKPFVKWPERVHLGLNNVDAISNSLLNAVAIGRDEHVLWVCKHKATYNFNNNDENSKISDGVIITDKSIHYVNKTKNESSCIDWSKVASITHQMNCFYIQRSLTGNSCDLKISDYAMLGGKVEDENPIVTFFEGVEGCHTNHNQKNGSCLEQKQEKQIKYEVKQTKHEVKKVRRSFL